MASDHRTELARIKRFDQLLAYLRDRLGWPTDGFEIDDLTFEYTPAELGIDAKNAAKIQEIKRLRPLSVRQPWGIFFVKFEPKRLPVVALRRILSQVALKKRASANKDERAAWAADDLLFISNLGEGDGRQISFAHFSSPTGDSLPTLKVLGWDNQDTPLHLDAVARELSAHLTWPEDDTNVDAWRQQWRSAFTVGHREVIETSEELSLSLAELARAIRDRVKTALNIESPLGPLTKLMKAFQEALIHDLSSDGFADMYAQTIAYGLLSARIVQPKGTTADDLTGHLRTSPFLRELMEEFLKVGGRRGRRGGPGIDFDELGVGDVQALLNRANMEAILRDFGDRNRQEDPVMHFFEGFLHAYDKKAKKERGVFYTPQPVVSYIVRSVHQLLQSKFDLADGLADTTTWGEMVERHPGLSLPLISDESDLIRTVSPDEPFVQILDPATGTATFLVEVIDVIYATLREKWTQARLTEGQRVAAWNEYVPKHLLPRLHAFELMMAPYAIAHMKVSLKLAETGYVFGLEERARIYLTNALEPWQTQLRLPDFEPLAHEAAAVNEIKRNTCFTVVIGNPPYSNFGKLNKNPFILGLLDDYKRGLNEKKLNLDDDFIKFVRFSQYLLQKSAGVLGYITNNVYLDGVTHRRMRESLMETFDDIRVMDLHGSSKRQEQSPDGGRDENVFDITIGVGIGLFTRGLFRDGAREVVHCDLWGDRHSKDSALQGESVTAREWVKLAPASPYYFFVPKDFDQLAEYQRGVHLQEVFPLFSSGIQTKRDNVAIAETKEGLLATLREFARLSTSELRRRYDLPDDGRDWRIEWATAHAKEILKSPEAVAPILYRPFDRRWTVMDSKSKGFVAYPRYEVMSQMLRENLGLIVTRQLSLPTFQHVFATRQLIDGNTISLQTREYNYLFPLYLPNDETNQRSLSFEGHGKANIGAMFVKSLSTTLGVPVGPSGLPHGLTPEDIFGYVYAVFHSPGYRSRYREFLKIDFPRLPLTSSMALFRSLAGLGKDLVHLHLLESQKLDRTATEFVGGRNPEVEKISWSKNTVWVDRAQTMGFQGIPEEVWGFHIGGYQVCDKWLKDRKGRSLSKDEMIHYRKIVVALSETIKLMQKIDDVIDKAGGWPGAFQARRN